MKRRFEYFGSSIDELIDTGRYMDKRKQKHIGNCQSCGYKTILKRVEVDEEVFEFCSVCMETDAGDAFIHPYLYTESDRLWLKNVAYIANLISRPTP